jgi:hypothetical protein
MVGTTATAENRYFIGDASTGEDSAPKGVTMPVAKDFANKDFADRNFTNKDLANNDFASLSESIATNASLIALDGRKRRIQLTDLTEPDQTPEAPPAPPLADVAWPRPIPDALFGSSPAGGDPAAVAMFILREAAAASTEDGTDGAERPGVGVGRISWFPDRDLIRTPLLPPIHPATGAGAC